MLNVLDIFSGIGGFSLGLERTGGFRTVAFCEIDPHCRAVLRKHWPGVPCHDDVRTFAGVPCDVICGGFPCQDISTAGKGAGIDGARSGLWSEYARLIGELRPSYAIVENVAALLGRGIGRVLGDLSEIGYDAEWHVISAASVGAPHRRERVWIVAYPNGQRCNGHDGISSKEGSQIRDDARCHAGANGSTPTAVANANRAGLSFAARHRLGIVFDQAGASTGGEFSGGIAATRRNWKIEPDVGRVANGVPSRVDRLRALGNAVVPQIPELIGRAILEAERTR